MTCSLFAEPMGLRRYTFCRAHYFFRGVVRKGSFNATLMIVSISLNDDNNLVICWCVKWVNEERERERKKLFLHEETRSTLRPMQQEKAKQHWGETIHFHRRLSWSRAQAALLHEGRSRRRPVCRSLPHASTRWPSPRSRTQAPRSSQAAPPTCSSFRRRRRALLCPPLRFAHSLLPRCRGCSSVCCCRASTHYSGIIYYRNYLVSSIGTALSLAYALVCVQYRCDTGLRTPN